MNNYCNKDFPLSGEGGFATDGSVMTPAVAPAVARALPACARDWEKLGEETVSSMRALDHEHPDCGFGACSTAITLVNFSRLRFYR